VFPFFSGERLRKNPAESTEVYSRNRFFSALLHALRGKIIFVFIAVCDFLTFRLHSAEMLPREDPENRLFLQQETFSDISWNSPLFVSFRMFRGQIFAGKSLFSLSIG